MKVKEISQTINHNVLILFWQFAIKTCEELDIVSNQNLAIEMFLIRLIYISSIKNRDEDISSESIKSLETEDNVKELKTEAVSQIRNITQEKKIKLKKQNKIKEFKKFSIDTFDDLIDACTQNKEIKLKYELEKT